MNILFINPPIRTQTAPIHYPIGICYVASFLKKAGYNVKVIDINGFRYSKSEFINILRTEKFDAIGLGGLITTYNHIDWIANHIKSQFPDTPIFAGNTVASTIPEILLRNTSVDVAVNGEGEQTVLELVERIENNDSFYGLKGIYYKNKDAIIKNPEREPIINLDELPFPAWDLVPLNKYISNFQKIEGYRSVLISTIRGCPYNCRFCCKTFIGYKMRSRTPGSIIDELKLLVKKFNINGFLPADDLFIFNKKRIFSFCDLLIAEGLDYLKWTASARANLITDEIVRKVKESGCIRLDFGFESNNQDILNYYNKRMTVQDQQFALDICKKNRMPFHISYIIGARNDTKKTIRDSYNFARKNNFLFYPENLLMPQPGTEIYNECLSRGLIKNELEYIKRISTIGDSSNFVINVTDELSDDELLKIYNKYRKINFIQTLINQLGNFDGNLQKIKKSGLKLFLIQKMNILNNYINAHQNNKQNTHQNFSCNEWL